MAELWVTEPGPPQLITRYRDMPATLATGSRSADVTADLVYVGRGDTAADYDGKDVKRQDRPGVRAGRSPRTTWPSGGSAPKAS